MNAPAETQRENGGLFALTISEATILLRWADVAGNALLFGLADEEDALLGRLWEWRRRHEDVG